MSGLDDDAAAVPDLDVQVMVVEQEHTYQGCGIGYVGIDIPGLTVPYYRHIVNVEGFLAAVAKITRLLVTKGSPNSVTSAGGKMRKRLKPVSTTASTCRAAPPGRAPGRL